MKANNLAKHIINYCIGIENPISNLQLQHIMYLTHIYYMMRTNKKLITDDGFIAYDGVIRIDSIHKKYNFHASNPIQTYEETDEEFDDIRGELYGFIDKVSKLYTTTLIKKCIEVGSPYYKTKIYKTISDELILEYCNKLRSKI